MGEIADEMVDGLSCCHCGIYFIDPHGYPVLCHDCYDSETKPERAGIQRSFIIELDEYSIKKSKTFK